MRGIGSAPKSILFFSNSTARDSSTSLGITTRRDGERWIGRSVGPCQTNAALPPLFSIKQGTARSTHDPLVSSWLPDLCVRVFCYKCTMKIRSLSILLLSILSWSFAFAQQTPLSIADGELPSLLATYKDIHSHPELSGHAGRTCALIAKRLRAVGCEVTEDFGKYDDPKVTGYGVIAIMKNDSGPIVLVRTDMDALPVEEETGLPYASNVTTKNDEGKDVHVMHACGHDAHIAAFIGTARALQRLKDQWHGTILFVAQPAEELGTGARALLKAGLYNRFGKPDFALGYHDKADMETGHIGVTEGYTYANVDSVDVTVRGVVGHGAYPHKTKDPIVLAAEMINAWQTIASRENNPLDPVVVTVGSIHGGTKHNIISDVFFSSRRRHTRFDCDWSSDVCSSDLGRRASRRTKSSRSPSDATRRVGRRTARGARSCGGSARPAGGEADRPCGTSESAASSWAPRGLRSLELPEIGVLEEAGAGREQRRHQSEAPVLPAAVHNVVTHEPPRRTAEQVPRGRAAAARLQLLGGPASVHDHLLEVVGEVAVRHVPERRAQVPYIRYRFEALVHAVLGEAAAPAEQPRSEERRGGE